MDKELDDLMTTYLEDYGFEKTYKWYTKTIEGTVEEFLSKGNDLLTALGRTEYEFDPYENTEDNQTFCEIIISMELIRVMLKKGMNEIAVKYRDKLLKDYDLKEFEDAVTKVVSISCSEYIKNDLSIRIKEIQGVIGTN
jgi:hypothetical protein